MARPRANDKTFLHPGAEHRVRKAAFRKETNEPRNVSQNASIMFPQSLSREYGEGILHPDLEKTVTLEDLIELLRDMCARDAALSRMPADNFTNRHPGFVRAPSEHYVPLENSGTVSHGRGRALDIPSQLPGNQLGMAVPNRHFGTSRLASNGTANGNSTRTLSSNLRVPSYASLKGSQIGNKSSYSTIDDIISLYRHCVPDGSSQRRPTLEAGVHERSNDTTNTMKRYREMESYVLSSHIAGNPFGDQNRPPKATDHNQQVLRDTATAFMRGITRPPSPPLKDNRYPTHRHKNGRFSPESRRLGHRAAGNGFHDSYAALDQADQVRKHGANADRRLERARRDRADAWNKLEGAEDRRKTNRVFCGENKPSARWKSMLRSSVAERNPPKRAELQNNDPQGRKHSDENRSFCTGARSYQTVGVGGFPTSKKFFKTRATRLGQTAPADRPHVIDRKHILRRSRTDQILISQGRDPIFSKSSRRPKKLQKKRRPGPSRGVSRKRIRGSLREGKHSLNPSVRGQNSNLRRNVTSVIVIDLYLGRLVSGWWRRRRRKRKHRNNPHSRSSDADGLMRQREKSNSYRPVGDV